MDQKIYTVKMTAAEMFTAYFHLMEAANMYERYARDAANAAEAVSVRYWRGEAKKARDLALKLQELSLPGPGDHRLESDA